MAAGHDIHPLKVRTIPAPGQILLDTRIAIELPKGTSGTLMERCGMTRKHRIAMGGGVIDADYSGEIKVIPRKHGNRRYEFKADDRSAPLIVEKIQTHHAMEIDNLINRKGEPRHWAQAKSVPDS